MVSLDRFCVILRSNTAIVSPAFHPVGAWLYVILRSNAAIVSSVWSIAGHICACVIRACLKHVSGHERLMLRVSLVLMLVGSHFSFLMLILISVLGFLLYNFVYFLKFCFCCTVRSCSGQNMPTTSVINTEMLSHQWSKACSQSTVPGDGNSTLWQKQHTLCLGTRVNVGYFWRIFAFFEFIRNAFSNACLVFDIAVQVCDCI